MEKGPIPVTHKDCRIHALRATIVAGLEFQAVLEALESEWYPPEAGELAEAFGALRFVLQVSIEKAKERVLLEQGQLPKTASSISASSNDR